MVDRPVEWWRDRLLSRLVAQADVVVSNEQWYYGNHPLPQASASNSDLFKNFQSMAKTNFTQVVVDEVASRLAVTGLRTGNDEWDARAWDIWQRSDLDSEQSILMTSALAGGIGYLSIWPDEDEGWVEITPEHGAEVTHEFEPGSQHAVAAALKVFDDEIAGETVAILWLKDRIVEWRSAETDGMLMSADMLAFSNSWTKVNEYPNPIAGTVPIVPLRNRPTLRRGWASELRDAIPIQRRINQTLLNLMVAEEAVAFPQRWVTGLEIEKDANGNAKRPFKSGPDSLWAIEDPDVKFGEFSESRFDGYLSVIRSDVEAMSTTTRTPLFALSAHLAVPPSAEALSAMESGLVKKVQKRQRVFGEAFEEAVRIAFKFEGNADERLDSMEVVWEDPRIRSDAALGDYAVKMQAVGVPQEAVWELVGATPQQIAQWREMSMTQAFQQLIAQVGQQQAAQAAQGPVRMEVDDDGTNDDDPDVVMVRG